VLDGEDTAVDRLIDLYIDPNEDSGIWVEGERIGEPSRRAAAEAWGWVFARNPVGTVYIHCGGGHFWLPRERQRCQRRLLMAVTCGGLYVLFKRRRWL
jgi:hypothetical protein